MKAGDVKCPECGAGFRDVAPDYEIGPEYLPYSLNMGGTTGAISGHCTNGHHFFAQWGLGEDGRTRYGTRRVRH